MTNSTNSYFTPFNQVIELSTLPFKFTYPFDYTPHPLCLLAAKQLQEYLTTQQDFEHNFGLDKTQEGMVIGKMFGVLVVQTQENELGYLAAFSGKLAGANQHIKFVPPVYDGLVEGNFINLGMLELSRINEEIKTLEEQNTTESNLKITELKTLRKANSIALQDQIFDQYFFINQSGEEKGLREIFNKPPSGAGECAAPKLLQYAFLNKLKPIAMAEFWWGQSPKSDYWKHGHFYPACKEKCEPILAHMLKDIEMDGKPF
ncbi:MAG: pseudouridylate synthase [Flavobacteriales bacterium]|nr:pseudouridylate synthase [Flavobacteriales bacterium]MCB9175111.1 pseudouridylate synthase [Flavobacteriales bacterium]